MNYLGKRILATVLATGLTVTVLGSDLSVMQVHAQEVSENDIVIEETVPETTEETSEEMTEETDTEEETEEPETEEVVEEETTTEENVAAENTAASINENVGFTLSADEDGVLQVVFDEGVEKISGNVLIPAEVKEIPKSETLFYTNTDVTKVTFETGSLLEKIDEGAFFATPVTEIKIPSKVTSIGAQAFYSAKLKKVTFEADGDGIALGDMAFANNAQLTTITTNARLRTIGKSTFADDSSLDKTVDLTGVTQIGERAFYNCSALDYIKIPDTMSVIEKSTFENCKSFGKYEIDFYRGTNAVALGTGITEIKDSAFSGCSGLEEIMLPKQVSRLGSNVFNGCTALKTVTIYNSDGADKTSACNIALTYTSFPALKGLTLKAYDGTVEDWVGSHTTYGVTFETLYKDYAVSYNAINNGTIKANSEKVKMGKKVTLTVTPAAGYVLRYGSLYYTYEDESGITQMGEIDQWDYTFIMPESDVKIFGSFIKSTDAQYGSQLTMTEDSLIDKSDDAISYDESTKILSFPKPWQNVRISVTGENERVPVYSELVFKSSNPKVATIDDHGNIRVIAVGTSNITVSLADTSKQTKALNFKIEVKEKSYVKELDFTYSAPRATIDYASSPNGEAHDIGYDIITYPSSLLNTASRSIVVTPNGRDEDGDILYTNYQVSTNDATVAKQRWSQITGKTGRVDIPKGALGETVITVKALDGAKEPITKQFIVRVVDDTPRLSNSVLSVDPQSVTGTLLNLVSVYDAEPNVDSLSIEKKVVKKQNTTYESTDDLFELLKEDGKVYLKVKAERANDFTAGQNYTYKDTYYVHGILSDSDTEFYIPISSLTICKKNIKPTVKLSGKINLFYNGTADIKEVGEIKVTQSQKDLTVERYELLGTTKTNGVDTADDGAFANNFEPLPVLNADKTISIRRTTNDMACYTAGKSKGKPVLSGILRIWYEGYTNPFDVKITIPTCTTAPSYSLNISKISLNSYATGQEYEVQFINKKTKKAEDLTDETEILLDTSEGGTTDGLIYEDPEHFAFDSDEDTIHLMINNAKKGKITLILKQPTWENQTWNSKSTIKATVTVSVTNAFPTVKLGKTTLTVNTACPAAADSTTMKLTQTDSTLADTQIFRPTGKAQDDDLKVRYDSESGKLFAEITGDGDGIVNEGNYSFTCTPEFCFKGSATKDSAKSITVKVKVIKELPSITLKSSTFSLNANCAKKNDTDKYDSVSQTFTWKNLPAEYSDYELSTEDLEFVLKGKGTDYIGKNNIQFAMDAENRNVTVYLETPSKRTGTCTYTVNGLKLTNEDVEIPIKPFAITIKSIDKTPTVTVSAKGSINPLDSASKIEYTPKLANVSGKIVDVKIRELGENNSQLTPGTEHFTARHDTTTGKTIVKVKDGATLENRTYKIQLFYEISNGMGESNRVEGTYQVAKDQKIIPKQTMPKIKTDVTKAKFFAGNKSKEQTITITKTSTTTADISGVKFSSKTSQTLQNAFEIVSFNRTTGEMKLKLKNSAFIKQNVEQTLTFEIVCDGQLKDTQGTTFTVKVTVIK
ncbi:MAG: leucine-rich repeat protein [Lachnospiraceae bacterium]|nr:leucine-rich repeat protein [Lachnospiraceae bacterium]